MQGKKSFILYCDLISVIEKLPDEKAGELFKIILEYVNDKNPKIKDLLLQIAFEPIRNQLKRDLMEWKEERHQRSEAGKKGMAKRWQNKGKTKKIITKHNTVTNPITNITDTVTVTVTDTVNDTVNEIQTAGAIEFNPVLLKEFEEIKNFYGFNEIAHPDKTKRIAQFLTLLNTKNNLIHFEHQFKYYQLYKLEAKEKKHGFDSFLDGKWNGENWEKKYNDLKKSSPDSWKEELSKIPPPLPNNFKLKANV